MKEEPEERNKRSTGRRGKKEDIFFPESGGQNCKEWRRQQQLSREDNNLRTNGAERGRGGGKETTESKPGRVTNGKRDQLTRRKTDSFIFGWLFFFL